MITVKSFEVNYFSENTYLLYDETKEAVLIDCGCMHEKEFQGISDYIQENKLILKRNLCTHLHLDHIAGNAFVKKAYGIAPEANQADEILPSAEEQSKAFGLPIVFNNVPLKSYLKEGDRIQFGHSELQVIETPGHTPGGLSFYAPTTGFVIVGDSLFRGSIGRTDLWGGNHEALVNSIRQKLMTLPSKTVVYPGHGPTTTIENEKRINPYI